MTARRTYGDDCAAAHALDLVGERWALLVVRELLFGPKRFSDLRRGMPNASPNVLSQRLRELEEVGVVRRHRLGPPVSSWVYELTDWGLGLEPVLTHLGRWGRRSPLHPREAEAQISVDSLMLALRSHFDPSADVGLTRTYALNLGDDHFCVRITDGRLDIARGEAPAPDAVIETDTRTFTALLAKRQRLDEMMASGRLRLTGDAESVGRLFDLVAMP
jgi:DNA-binding HxlR family transcriptional regulator/putative sterol carrier protein